MKRLDWIIASVLVLMLAAGLVYYFLGYRKGKTLKEMLTSSIGDEPGTTSGGSTGASSGGSSGGSSSPQPLPIGSLPLKKGDKNQKVVLMQRGLNFLGADLIVDGNFGQLTQNALFNELGTNILDIQKAAELFVKVRDWAYAQTPVNTAIINELQQLTGS